MARTGALTTHMTRVRLEFKLPVLDVGLSGTLAALAGYPSSFLKLPKAARQMFRKFRTGGFAAKCFSAITLTMPCAATTIVF